MTIQEFCTCCNIHCNSELFCILISLIPMEDITEVYEHYKKAEKIMVETTTTTKSRRDIGELPFITHLHVDLSVNVTLPTEVQHEVHAKVD